ncbi:hypothetical protein CDCA_CDCA04G1260 [Cyanidium caldarium]|uniref:DNA replication complex GINS protein SLD5 n=1 Tax=Cyanidium caldarium TaxID=2771 RepID=A0AAV9ISG3_CYACA|nr:hypothetical protein CDCA_CDCA04G1260 [Cyanidium caldarium]
MVEATRWGREVNGIGRREAEESEGALCGDDVWNGIGESARRPADAPQRTGSGGGAASEVTPEEGEGWRGTGFTRWDAIGEAHWNSSPGCDLNDQIEQLQQAVSDEVCAPELLPFAERLVADVQAVLQYQQQQLGQVHADTANGIVSAIGDRLAQHLQRQDCMRVRYALRNYYRVRLWKAQRHATHYLRESQSDPRCLSPLEEAFLRRYQRNMVHHLNESFLKHVPEPLRRLDDVERNQSGHGTELNMVTAPDLDEYVVARFVHPCELDLAATGQSLPQAFPFRQGDVFCLRYRFVRDALLRGDVELI